MARARVLGQLYSLPASRAATFEPMSQWSRPRKLAALRDVERRLAALGQVAELELTAPMQPIGAVAREETRKLLVKRRRLLRRALGMS